MQKILVDLQNCYGIKSLKAEFDFSKDRSVAIYAPNGAMKSSFAQTFMDVATGESSRDRIFPKRVTSRKITDHQNNDLKSEKVVVLRPYDEVFGDADKVSTLLVDRALRTEYEKLIKDIEEAKERGSRSRTKRNSRPSFRKRRSKNQEQAGHDLCHR